MDFGSLSKEELQRLIKKKLVERRKILKELKFAKETVNDLRNKEYPLWSGLKTLRRELGSRKGSRCPAKRKQNYDWICRAKRYKYVCYSLDEFYRTRCSHCHLTKGQAKNAILYDTILNGRRR